jgi:hypothetical protein
MIRKHGVVFENQQRPPGLGDPLPCELMAQEATHLRPDQRSLPLLRPHAEFPVGDIFGSYSLQTLEGNAQASELLSLVLKPIGGSSQIDEKYMEIHQSYPPE